MRTTAIAIVSVLVMACSVQSSDPVASDSEELTCRVPSTKEAQNPWWKSQYDGSICQDDNCGMAAIAMLRNALTCGASDHAGGWVRKQLNEHYRLRSGTCGGTNPNEWRALLEAGDGHGHWLDGTTKLDVVEHDADGFGIDDLAEKMSHGWMAIIAGNAKNGQKAPCGFVDAHALFVGNWNGSTFSMYDPDSHDDPGRTHPANCGSTRTGHATAEWTKDELRLWASGIFSDRHDLWVVLARLPRASGCVPGTTRTCTSPECCGTCGHATQTCTADRTWSTGTCRNGC